MRDLKFKRELLYFNNRKSKKIINFYLDLGMRRKRKNPIIMRKKKITKK